MSCTVTRSLLRRSFAAVSVLLVSAVVCLAGKHFVMPAAQPAKTYPAHDEHSGESVTLGLDPYDLPDKASIFSVHYSDVGLMPIFVVITNDGDQTVALSGMKAELVTVNRTKIPPSSEDDIYRRISRPTGTISPNPLPWPKKAKGSISKDAMEEIQNTQFAAKAVEPHGTQSGFMFFDVSDIPNPLAGAHFYLTGVRDAKGNELMYFEVPLEKYLSAPEKQK
ncbi:MAG TPA: hypothetical protein VK788_14690 [Terriglobales bacterium]|jgi:hypothetical protein|nr:hypothetical protein [Terriglobales bacterium]